MPQLSDFKTFNVNNIIFSDVVINNKPVNHKRIYLNVDYGNGLEGPILFSTEKLYSSGVKSNSLNTDTYTLPLYMFSQEGSTEDQRKWVSSFDNIVEKCKDHLQSNNIGNPISRSNIDSCMWQRDKKEAAKGPILYVKVETRKNPYTSRFFETKDIEDNSIDPQELLVMDEGPCFVKAVVKFESIFIGNKISLQVKLYEALFQRNSMKFVRLLQKQPQELLI